MLMKTKKILAAACAVALFGTQGGLVAQEKADAKKIDIDARKRSVANLEQHIGDREQRLAAIAEDIIRLDSRVEGQIGKIVGRLKTIEDSTESQVRVAQTKENAIEGLRKTIDYYARKRDEIKEQLRKDTTASRETLQDEVAKFDARIDKRIGQIIDLSKSFTEHKELEKYETWTEEKWDRSDTNYRISDEWRHNRKSFRHSEAQQREIGEALAKSVERLERRTADLEEKLKSTKLSPGMRQLLEEDLAHNVALTKLRMQQLHESGSSAGRPETTPVDRDEAHGVELSLGDAAKDLREDFFAIFENYDKLNKEREQIAKLKASLEARKAWLKKNAPG